MKKIFLKILIILGVFSFSLLDVDAASNPYNKNFNGGINCTWFAWQQAYDKAGVALPSWGNANTWFDSAKKAGYETGMTPRVNSIVVWQWNNSGHVGYVERVYGDYIYVWDSVYPDGCPAEMPDYYNCTYNHTLEEVDNGACDGVSKAPHGCPSHTTYWHDPGDLIGYIYLDNAPKKPITSGTTNQNTGTNTLAKKSSNANLSSIKISGIDFEFKRDNLEYNLEVKNDIESINIEATTEHDKAKVKGNGGQPLNVGENIVNLIVTAEDGTEKTYTIKIKRKDNNAYLTNLKISNIDFKFDKETLNYEFKIARDIESIDIKGIAESELATIDGLGTHKLSEEKNVINITITAEDGTEKTYTITLKKEPETFFNKKINIWMVLGIGIIALTILIFVIIYIIKKKIRKKKQKNLIKSIFI